jgi:hypothetical protein
LEAAALLAPAQPGGHYHREPQLGENARMEFADRAARNEEIFRGINERIEEGAEQHGVETALPFHCECGRASCLDAVDIPPPVYERVASERYRFVLIPGHEDAAIERVVERQASYVVVEKVGEAREQIDRDHPQQRHRS